MPKKPAIPANDTTEQTVINVLANLRRTCAHRGLSYSRLDAVAYARFREANTLSPLAPVHFDDQELGEFVEQIARMTKDGEELNGEEFIMDNDDAVDAVNGLIDTARKQIGRAH